MPLYPDLSGATVVAAVGTVGAPGVTFTDDLDTGIYWISANRIGVALGGALILDIGASSMKFGTDPVPVAANTYDLGSAALPWRIIYGNLGNGFYLGGTRVFGGGGTPEGSSTAPPGSLYLRSDGGAGTTFYVKESGTGNTGWVAK